MEISMERRLEIAQEVLTRHQRLIGTAAEADSTAEALGLLLAVVRDTVAEVKQLRDQVAVLQRR